VALVSEISTATSFAPRPSPSTFAVSNSSRFKSVRSGSAITTVCGDTTPFGVAQPLSARSSSSQKADQSSLYSAGFWTMRAPAENDTRLRSGGAAGAAGAAAAAPAGSAVESSRARQGATRRIDEVSWSCSRS